MRRFCLIILLFLSLTVSAARIKVTGIPYTYSSTDRQGDSVCLSGKIFVPESGQAKGIILLPHFTVSSNKEVPSQTDPVESRLARKGYVVFMPDYLGYGITRDRIHPYLDVEMEARQTVDMYLQAREYLRGLGVQIENDSLLIVGFSQGAAAAVACLRLLEEQYPQIPLKKCYAGSGPYDVCATYDHAVEHNTVGMAVVVPMLVMGTSEAYDLHLRPEDFFTPYMLKHWSAIVEEQRYGLVELALRMPSRRLSRFMTAEGMDKTQPETARMYEGFKRSSIVFYEGNRLIMPEWTPRTPIFLFHSTNDDTVCFECAEHLRMFLDARGASYNCDFGRYGSHLMSLMRFLRIMNNEL